VHSSEGESQEGLRAIERDWEEVAPQSRRTYSKRRTSNEQALKGRSSISPRTVFERAPKGGEGGERISVQRGGKSQHDVSVAIRKFSTGEGGNIFRKKGVEWKKRRRGPEKGGSGGVSWWAKSNSGGKVENGARPFSLAGWICLESRGSSSAKGKRKGDSVL